MFNRIVAWALALSLIIANAATTNAAVTANSIITAQTPNLGVVQFLQGTDSAGTYKTLYTGGANGSKCFGMMTSNNDGSATHLLTVQIVRSTVFYGGAAITSVESAGYANAVPPQSLMSSAVWPGLPVDGNGNPFVFLNSGDTIQMTFATNLTSSTQINAKLFCTDF